MKGEMPRETPDYILDIDGITPPPNAHVNAGKNFRGRPWLAVKWRCCSTYSRVYRNRAGDAYEGRCPKCGSPVKAMIGAGGTRSRFFEAG